MYVGIAQITDTRRAWRTFGPAPIHANVRKLLKLDRTRQTEHVSSHSEHCEYSLLCREVLRFRSLKLESGKEALQEVYRPEVIRLRHMKSSIYHFFAELLTYRGHLVQQRNLEEYEKFPDSLIAARSFRNNTFPDLVLRNDADYDPPGGELIELKTSRAFSIPPFNSTPPSAKKSMGSLSKKLRLELQSSGETFELSDMRDVYYLLVGRKDAKPSPLTKVCLVHGSFFDTLPLREVLLQAGNRVFCNASGARNIDLREVFEDESAEEIRKRFNATRTVTGAGFKVRFRTMYGASDEVNLMKESSFPLIVDDTISFISKVDELESNVHMPLTNWDVATEEMRSLQPYSYLSNALEDVDPRLKQELRIGTMFHPLSGTYFLSQADLR